MTRSTLFAATATLALLAGCSGPPAENPVSNQAMPADEPAIEDVPSDSLAAPDDMPLDTESNAAGSASGGNAN